MSSAAHPSRERSNTRVALILLALVAAMVGMAFAAVPLYDLFCRVTGYGGTTQVADGASSVVVDRDMRIRFDATKAGDLPWTFAPDQRELQVKVGENRLAFYKAKNLSDAPVTGTAVFNVTPPRAGLYFDKIECFCFTEQTLLPGQEVDMPVSFYVDPAIMDDAQMDDVSTITLSYTFYRSEQ